MSLNLMIDLIASIRADVVDKERKKNWNKSTENKAYAHFLEMIQHLLQQSEITNNVEILKEAILNLETVPIRSFIDNKKLGKLLTDQNHSTLIERDQINLFRKSFCALSNKHQKILTHIHQKLMNYFMFLVKNQNKAAWSLNYEFDQEQQEIMDDHIKAWQEDVMILSKSANAAYVDYLRDFGIQGMTNFKHTEHEIDDLIDGLISKSNYDEKDKILIKKWLKANGGQCNNRFIDFLLQGGHFVINRPGLAIAPTGYVSLDELLYPKYDKFGLLKSESFGQGWFIKNKKACFTSDIVVYSLTHLKKTCIFLDPEKEPNQLGDQLRMTNNMDYFFPQQKNKKALLRFQAEITLDIEANPLNENERHVKPKITFLNVTGYTHSLQPRHDLKNISEDFEPKQKRIGCKT